MLQKISGSLLRCVTRGDYASSTVVVGKNGVAGAAAGVTYARMTTATGAHKEIRPLQKDFHTMTRQLFAIIGFFLYFFFHIQNAFDPGLQRLLQRGTRRKSTDH